MPSFLALQCYKCSMMQVKQEKKSSNKWICAVCNEKQSVRNVFASSTAAKDVRIFVQEFNLSRHTTSMQDQSSMDNRSHAYTEIQEEEEEVSALLEEPSTDWYGEDQLRCLNVQRNISSERDPVRKESRWNGYMTPQRNISCDGLESSESVTKKSKWEEFLTPEGNEMPEVSEDASEYNKKFMSLFPDAQNAKFVTVFPDAKNLKRKNMNEKPPNKSRAQISHKLARNKSEICNEMSQKENCLQFGLNKKTLYSKMQRNDNVQILQAKIKPSENHLEVVKMERNSALESPRPKRNVMEKPISKWAAFLDSDEMMVNQANIENPKEAQVVSKWEKYMISDHVDRRLNTIQNHDLHVESGNSDDETFDMSERIHEKASVWSLKASSKNLRCFDSVITTHLDDLMDVMPFSSNS